MGQLEERSAQLAWLARDKAAQEIAAVSLQMQTQAASVKVPTEASG